MCKFYRDGGYCATLVRIAQAIASGPKRHLRPTACLYEGKQESCPNYVGAKQEAPACSE